MLLLVLSLLAPASAASFGPWLDGDPPPMSMPEPPSIDIDATVPACEADTLADGEQLPAADTLYRWDPNRSWGTPELVATITAAADTMAWLLPGADPLMVGDMSRVHGGALGGHKEHRGGIDADIGLYTGDHRQPLEGFRDVPPPQLDTEATWLLVKSLVDTGRVEWILLDPGLIARLRTYVLTNHLMPAGELDRILPPAGAPSGSALVRPAANHRNHLHLRVLCENGGDTGDTAVGG